MRRKNPSYGIAAMVALAALGLVLSTGADVAKEEDTWLAGEFEGSREEITTLMGYYDSIELTLAQEEVRKEALGPVPAYCCKEFSAATCCCVCNLSRTLWGLSKFLIVEKGADAAQVREAVESLVAVLNPSGYEGETCMTGSCNRPFKEGGCGGMNKHQLML